MNFDPDPAVEQTPDIGQALKRLAEIGWIEDSPFGPDIFNVHWTLEGRKKAQQLSRLIREIGGWNIDSEMFQGIGFLVLRDA